MSLFNCPICQSPLTPAADTWRCDGSLHPAGTRHPFDVARQGYVNLLPVQHKKSKAPGDSVDSIAARQRFLQAGHYQPLQDLICEQLDEWRANRYGAQHQGPLGSIDWLDVGCGEGYYTRAIAQRLAAHNSATAITSVQTKPYAHSVIAADISKPAVASLAKTSKAAQQLWYQSPEGAAPAQIFPLVTSAAQLPIKPQGLDGISSIFSPILPQAFAEVLRENGCLLIAKPDSTHLLALREALFDEVREYDSAKFLEQLAPYFELQDTQRVSCELVLTASDLADLMTMTPYAYRAQAHKRQTLLARHHTQPFRTHAKFVLYRLQKKAQ